MTDYSAPLDDIRFVLDHVVDLEEVTRFPDFEGLDSATIHGALEEAARFFEEQFAPLNAIGDQQTSVHHPDGTVTTPDGFIDAYEQYVAAGWGGVPFPPAYGGGGFPWTTAIVLQEIMTSANMAFSMAPLLTQGAIDLLLAHGDEALKETFLPKMVSGEWTGTMNLTEPEAGSDVGALRSKAVPNDDGTWNLSGTKIFISFGEHDMADNIVHLVLARVPDAPPGTKGISCFIVPKFLVGDDGSLGDRNAVQCVSIEHKMGIRASPTCVLEYDDAVGYLIGEPNAGMRYMFTMMNNARLSVGLEGLSLAERAWQPALGYAKERNQGRAPGAEKGTKSPIVDHADVRRMLMTMKASIEALRALIYTNAVALDHANHHPDEDGRTAGQELADLLTPISKGWGTDLGVEVTSLAIQVFGGMGYVEETGVAQHYRDARIAPIYEGTNGIQAMDLVGRKLPMRAGGVVTDYIARLRRTAAALEGIDELESIRVRLEEGIDVLEGTTNWVLTNGLADANNALAGATPYLRIFGQVTGGWLLAKSAHAAHDLLAAGEGDAEFLKSKIATARFYADHLLPLAKGLVDSVEAGPAELFAIPADAL